MNKVWCEVLYVFYSGASTVVEHWGDEEQDYSILLEGVWKLGAQRAEAWKAESRVGFLGRGSYSLPTS